MTWSKGTEDPETRDKKSKRLGHDTKAILHRKMKSSLLETFEPPPKTSETLNHQKDPQEWRKILERLSRLETNEKPGKSNIQEVVLHLVKLK